MVNNKEIVYLIWQVWDDNGDMFLMGVYKTLKRAKEEIDFIKEKEDLSVQYIIRTKKVIS